MRHARQTNRGGPLMQLGRELASPLGPEGILSSWGDDSRPTRGTGCLLMAEPRPGGSSKQDTWKGELSHTCSLPSPRPTISPWAGVKQEGWPQCPSGIWVEVPDLSASRKSGTRGSLWCSHIQGDWKSMSHHPKDYMYSSVQFSSSVVSDSLRPHESQHARPPCPSPTSPNSCPSSRWCHPAISSSIVPFSSPAPKPSQHQGLFQWVNSSHEVAKILEFPLQHQSFQWTIQDWSPLGWTDWTSLLSKGLSTVFSNTTVQKHQFFSAQPSSQSNSHIHTWPLEKS